MDSCKAVGPGVSGCTGEVTAFVVSDAVFAAMIDAVYRNGILLQSAESVYGVNTINRVVRGASYFSEL